MFFDVDFLKQAFTNTVFHVIMSILNQYHHSELIIHRKLDNSGCKIMLYTNFILMFQFFNININLPHHYCWLHKSLYCTVLSSWFTKMHLNHLFHSLFPLQLLYNHKSALINMHHNEGSSEQTILQPNQQCNHLHHNKGSKQTILQLNQQCNHITGLWIRLNTFRLNQYISLQSHTWIKSPPIYSSFMILGLNYFSAVIVICYISKMRQFSQMDAIFFTV